MSCHRKAQQLANSAQASGVPRVASMNVYYNTMNVHTGKAKTAFNHLMIASDTETLVELIELIFFKKLPRPKKKTAGQYAVAASAASIAFGLSLFVELNKAAIKAVLNEYRFWQRRKQQRRRLFLTMQSQMINR